MTQADHASRPMTEQEVSNWLDARNSALEEESRLFVARHRVTGLYSTRIERFLWGSKSWIAANNSTVEEVIEELRLSDERSSMWTSEINRAEVWQRYSIEQYSKYIPDVEFVGVELTTVPM